VRLRARIAFPALSAALALVGLAVPIAAHASLPTGSGLPTETENGITIYCDRPSQWQVVANNIHIRATPNGNVLYPIANGAKFDSVWHVTCSGLSSWYELYTADQYGGQQWLKGWSHANPSHVGWVGGAYLTFIKYCDRNGC